MNVLKSGSTIALFKNLGSHKPIMLWLLRYTKTFAPMLLLLLLSDLVSSGISISMTLINRHIVDTASAGGAFTSSIWLYSFVLLSALLVNAANGVIGLIINERFAFTIRINVYKSVMESCWDQLSKHHSGDIVTRLTSDIDIVAGGIADVIPSILSLGARFVMAFATLAYFDLGFAIFAVFLGPITAFIGIVSGKLLKPLQERIQQTESEYRSFLQESIANIVIFKAFEAQQTAVDRLSSLRSERLKWIMDRQKVSVLSSTIMSLSFQAGYLAAFVYSTIQLSQQNITFGTMSLFISMVSQIQSPIIGLSHLLPSLVSIFTSAGRIIEVEHIPSEDMETKEHWEGGIGLELQHVSFSYTDSDDNEILADASVRIEPGEFVALVGSSGIGKSTMIRLVMAYLNPGSGALALFNQNGDHIPINAGARTFMSYVPQGNTLISGSILDNIRLANQEATEEEIWELLGIVAVDQFVRSTPDGLNTAIGERGLGLSEGQAQRIAIARALAKKAPFLILDEATSALDESTEIAVLRHLSQYREGLTCLIITHRRNVLRFCDRCIRIEDGHFVEEPIPLNFRAE